MKRVSWSVPAPAAALLCAVLAPVGLALFFGSHGSAQTPAVAPFTVTGQVINASTGSGIARALVSVGQRSVLTDAQGAFQLPQFTESTTSLVRVQKPGFSSFLSQQEQILSSGTDVTQPLLLRLYPDGLVTGTVSGPDGEPLERVYVQLERAQYDPTGLHTNQAGSSSTDARGQYRFRVPAGHYRLRIGYTPQLEGSSKAVLPEHYPADSADNAFFPLAAAEQKVIDLRPAVSQTHMVAVKPDGVDLQFGFPVTATSARGESFQLGAQIISGEARISLPSGTYLLRSTTEILTQTYEGLAKVTVAGQDVSGIPMHMAPVATLPVEISGDLSISASGPAAAPPALPNPTQLNLYLHAQSTAGEFGQQEIRMIARGTAPAEFHVPAGRYRLRGFTSGAWNVESVTCGQTNLLTSELVIAAGSGGSTVRIVATNRSGKISGTVQPATSEPSGTVPQGWVYLVSESPSLIPYQKLRITRRGTFAASMMPGHYYALAVPHSLEADLTDPEVAGKFGRLGKQFEVTDQGQATVTLALASADVKEPE